MNNGKPPLSVYAHMDTVPIEEGWDFDPFGCEIKDGRVYGRGVADMKGAIASVLTALEVMQAEGLEPAWDLNVLSAPTKRSASIRVCTHLALEGYATAPMLCLEGSQDPVLRRGSNGSMDVSITVKGRAVTQAPTTWA